MWAVIKTDRELCATLLETARSAHVPNITHANPPHTSVTRPEFKAAPPAVVLLRIAEADALFWGIRV